MKRLVVGGIALGVVVMVVAGFIVYLTFTSGDNVAGAEGGTLRSSDGQVQVVVPVGGALPGTKATFKPQPALASSLNKNMKGVSALGSPVDIQVTSGKLLPNKSKVVFTYNPARLPRGVTPIQLGVAVFDENLGGWVPILGATVDAKAHTVTALAPHFSVFSLDFLDPLKKAVSVAGQVIITSITAYMTIKEWYGHLLTTVASEFIKDVTATAPTLKCNPASKLVTATTKSVFNWLTACTETTKGSDTTVRIRNGFGFPLLADALPKGFVLRLEDVWNNGDDLVNLLRNFFWTTQSRAVLPPAALGSVTVTSAMTSTATMTAHLDDTAVAFDMLLAFVMVIFPVESAMRSVASQGLKAFLLDGTKLAIGAKGSAAANVQRVFDAMDCTVQALHQDLRAILSQANAQQAANAVHGCLMSMLNALNLESALAELLSVVKVIPEYFQSKIAKTAQLVGLNTTSYSLTARRFDAGRAFERYVRHWQVHGSTLDIKADHTGFQWLGKIHCNPDTPLDENPALCPNYASIRFAPATPDGIVGTYTDVWYIDQQGHKVPGQGPNEEPNAIQKGNSFKLVFHGDHVLETIWLGKARQFSGNGGNRFWCDSYEMHSSESYICGA